jgi:hypothetical protein
MLRLTHAAVALTLASQAFAQTKEAEKAPATENLIKNPSFEEPAVKGRASWKDGGTPINIPPEKNNWAHFQVFGPDKAGEGKFTVGLTNEFARTGKQSLFVDFDKVTGTDRRSFLMTDLMPIKPANTYRISIWGRTDKKRPLTLDQRLVYMKTEIEFFTPDMESQAGEVANRTLMVPGNTKRLFFTSNKWTEYFTKVRAPRDAGWMKVTFRWETGREVGMTDGTIYFDDAAATLVPGGESLIPLDSSDTAKPEPEVEPENDGNSAMPAAAQATPQPAEIKKK